MRRATSILGPVRGRALVLALAVLAGAGAAEAAPAAGGGTVLSSFPAKPDVARRHIVYLHGRIVEEQGRRAVSPDFGEYQLDEILAGLRHGFLYQPLPEWVRPATDWTLGRKIDR